MLLPRVSYLGPGVEAHGLQVDPYSPRLMRVSAIDIALQQVASPWGPVTLAATHQLAQLVLVVSPRLDTAWVIRAPLAVVRARLASDPPAEWEPPSLPAPGLSLAR